MSGAALHEEHRQREPEVEQPGDLDATLHRS
jgi:hypothetical protein